MFAAMSGKTTYRVFFLQNCSFYFSIRVVLVKFGMRRRPSILMISDDCGHASSSRTTSTDMLSFESNRGSKSDVVSARLQL